MAGQDMVRSLKVHATVSANSHVHLAVGQEEPVFLLHCS